MNANTRRFFFVLIVLALAFAMLACGGGGGGGTGNGNGNGNDNSSAPTQQPPSSWTNGYGQTCTDHHDGNGPHCADPEPTPQSVTVEEQPSGNAGSKWVNENNLNPIEAAICTANPNAEGCK